MSYTILYRTMFVKLKNNTYIPIVESGDNNVYEANNRRRAREWTSCRWIFESEEQKKRYAFTENEILANVQKDIDRTVQQYERQEPAFGGEPYTKKQILSRLNFFNCIKICGHNDTTASQFLSFFKSGFKNCITMEELQARGRWLILSYYQDEKYQKLYVNTEDELAEKWNQCQEKGIIPWIGLDYVDSLYKEIRMRNRKPRKSNPSERNFVVKFKYYDSVRYVVKLTSHRLRYNDSKQYAYRYASQKAAEKVCKNISNRYSGVTDATVEKISA